MTTQQRYVPAFVLVIIIVAIGYCLIPFRFADKVDCGAPLLGAHAKVEEPTTPAAIRQRQIDDSRGLIKPEIDCRSKGKSRLAVSGVASLLVAATGTAMVALKPESFACMSGNHDDCHEWWAGAMGGAASSFSCQCSCHAFDAL